MGWLNPQTMSMVTMGAQAAGSIVGGMSQGQAGDYQAAVARNNQTVANQNAQLELQKGQQQEAAARQRTAQTIGMERAGAGASGIVANTGSALRTQTDTASLGELDAQTIRNNAERSAWGYRVQGSNFDAQADLAQQQGQFGMMQSLISGAGNFGDKWNQYKKAGIPVPGG